MKTFALILALYHGSLGPTFALTSTPPHDLQGSFDFACKVMEYDCSSIEPPTVVWESLYHTYGIFGGYNGDDTIHMDNSVLWIADPVYVNSVIAHETVHYLDVKLGVLPVGDMIPGSKALCNAEMRAWRVGNAYVISNGRPDLANFDWHIRYGCFTQ